MRVKICGITNLEDALICIDAGVDALGFVFYENSPRYIDPKEVKDIIKLLPPFVERVGLFVNCEADFVNSVMSDCELSLAQIHFEANEEFFKHLRCKYLRVIRAKSKDDILKYEDEYRLVDAFVPSYGGEGKSIDLSWFDGVDCSKIILAGGVGVENIKNIKKYSFYGVDLSSSLEKSKGKKDKMKVDKFMKAVKSDNI